MPSTILRPVGIYFDDLNGPDGTPTLYGDFNPTPGGGAAGRPYDFRDYDVEEKN